jgi:hypothetical protein
VTSSLLGLIGVLFLFAAVVAAVLNLHRVANLGMPWLGPLFMMAGLVLVILARRRQK